MSRQFCCVLAACVPILCLAAGCTGAKTGGGGTAGIGTTPSEKSSGIDFNEVGLRSNPHADRTLEAWKKAFEADEKAATEKYKFKYAKVACVIKRKSPGNYYVGTEATPEEIGVISFSNTEDENKKLKEKDLKPGDKVTVVGQVIGLSVTDGKFMMSQCELQ